MPLPATRRAPRRATPRGREPPLEDEHHQHPTDCPSTRHAGHGLPVDARPDPPPVGRGPGARGTRGLGGQLAAARLKHGARMPVLDRLTSPETDSVPIREGPRERGARSHEGSREGRASSPAFLISRARPAPSLGPACPHPDPVSPATIGPEVRAPPPWRPEPPGGRGYMERTRLPGYVAAGLGGALVVAILVGLAAAQGSSRPGPGPAEARPRPPRPPGARRPPAVQSRDRRRGTPGFGGCRGVGGHAARRRTRSRSAARTLRSWSRYGPTSSAPTAASSRTASSRRSSGRSWCPARPASSSAISRSWAPSRSPPRRRRAAPASRVRSGSSTICSSPARTVRTRARSATA